MNICILIPGYTDSTSLTKDVDIAYDAAPYLPGHNCTTVVIEKDAVDAQVAALVHLGFDLFLNLCDCTIYEDCAGLDVLLALERLGVAYTGANAAFFAHTRHDLKAACLASGIGTPAYAFLERLDQVEAIAHTLRFPLFVKHPDSYCSVGLTRHSRVENAAELARETARMLDAFGGVLVEEFIEGRELTALVIEDPAAPGQPLVFQPLEFLFPPGESFKHFDLKWVDYRGITSVPCQDAALSARLQEATRRLFAALNGSGYARFDFRVDRAGEIYALDSNANCGVFYPAETPGSADLILLNEAAGLQRFVDLLLAGALQRRALKP
jgi:D-alanine-D-alanine ligase